MNGSKKKKLLLSTTKQEFINRMYFSDDEEKQSCKNYLDLKGIAYHVVLVNYIGLDSDGMIQYREVQYLYIYDKRIRNTLYQFLAALEEGIRAFITNRYFNNLEAVKLLSKSVYNAIQEDSSLSKELENLDFYHLINIAMNLSENEKEDLFGYTENLESNLLAVKELRNTVSHHRMLFVYEDLNSCHKDDGMVDSSLRSNIINLRNLLNKYYKNFYTNSINKCTEDRKRVDFKELLPEKCILCI